MLVKLTVRNYALIRELDLDLGSGLTIITGETGAGKSILLGALSFILGTRADAGVLLDKSEKCVVEGRFRIREYDLEEFFKANDLDYEETAILRREINTAGKSRAFINDTPVTVSILKDLGDRLIDIHSQHQTLMLNENSFQLEIIDSFAGTASLRNDYNSEFSKFRKIRKEYSELKEKSDQNKADLEYFRFLYKQLDEARLKKGEQDELEKEQEILGHAEEIKLALSNITLLLSNDDSSILSKLREVKLIIGKIAGYLPEELNLLERINSAFLELDDIAVEAERLEQKTEADPERLAAVNKRIDTLFSLMQKHRLKSSEELLEKKEELESRISSIVTSDERLVEIEKILEVSAESLKRISSALSAKRRAAIPVIQDKITSMLMQLGIPNARFLIAMSSSGEFTQTGIDNADFLFSANRQTEPENISKIASGGELSRVMLSLKSMLAKNSNLPAIIFDEIDSGVSGEVADKVGQILSEMGRYMQVINITHLPQVASRGNQHFHVYKEDTGDSTITRIRLLSPAERVQEVARLLSGSEVTDTALKNARELIKAGSK